MREEPSWEGLRTIVKCSNDWKEVDVLTEYRKGCRQMDSAGPQRVCRSAERRCSGRKNKAVPEGPVGGNSGQEICSKPTRRSRTNHGAPGIDGMTVEALPWLQRHVEELRQSIREGSFNPNPVRRAMIPKPDGSGERKLGIPTGHRPNRPAGNRSQTRPHL